MPRKPTVLVVDDEKNILTSVSHILDLEGYQPSVAGSGRIALEKLATSRVDAVLLDVRMPEMDGLEVLTRIRERHGDIPVVMMSGHANLEVAVTATRAGANDFLEKPIGADRLLVTLQNALAFVSLKDENASLKQRIRSASVLVGTSEPMNRLKADIELAAPSRARVMITGENGTGKELVARAIHEGSPRKDGPFIKVNCAAIPADLIESELFGHEKGAFTGATRERKGKFEQADGGTIFLDEIGDMSANVQAKLLRVLQEEEVDRVGGTRPIRVNVRVLAATNKDLPAEIEAGQFREDLYYRINVIPIHVPPLRTRSRDMPALIEHFMSQLCTENDRRTKTVTDEAIQRFQSHHWPGNVRELRNICERLVILTSGDVIDEVAVTRALPGEKARVETGYMRNVSFKEMVTAAERRIIEAAIEDFDGHVTNAANGLGLERSHLYKKMKALGLR